MKEMTFIKLVYWIGIVADALWTVGLFFPEVFGILTGRDNFKPGIEIRMYLAIGGSLMAGWTLLLLWGVQRPIERRMICLLTAFPVVFGLFLVSLVGFLEGNAFNLWIIIKTMVLFILMVANYFVAGRVEPKLSRHIN
jgi:hypothetical protein